MIAAPEATKRASMSGVAAEYPCWPRGEFVRLCAPHMVGRWAHPESVCGCLHDHAAAAVQDADLREALLRGISETVVPTIETEWVPASKRSEIGPTFTVIAKPTLQCMFEPAN